MKTKNPGYTGGNPLLVDCLKHSQKLMWIAELCHHLTHFVGKKNVSISVTIADDRQIQIRKYPCFAHLVRPKVNKTK